MDVFTLARFLKTQNYSMLPYVINLSFGVCSVLKDSNVFNNAACNKLGAFKSMFKTQSHFWHVFRMKVDRHLFNSKRV